MTIFNGPCAIVAKAVIRPSVETAIARADPEQPRQADQPCPPGFVDGNLRHNRTGLGGTGVGNIAMAWRSVRRPLMAVSLCCVGPSIWASTGTPFSAQVQAHRDAMARSEAVANRAARECARLGAGPAMDDARCVAWRLHQRQRADRARAEACAGATEPPAIALVARCVLGGLTDSAA